jgi:hypothetical protein
MLAIRAKSSDSWLDPEFGGLVAWKFGGRLWRRVAREHGVFITLTYRRDPYAGPQDLYLRAGEGKHVARFMERLGKATGENFGGRWVCKAEFQDRGWVHFHLLVCHDEN